MKPVELPAVRSRPATSSAVTSPSSETEKKPFQSRFLQSQQPAATIPAKKEETESSSEEESSEEESETEEETKVKPAVVAAPIRSSTTATSSSLRSNDTPTSSPLRTGLNKDSTAIENRRSLEESSLPSNTTRSRYEPASSYSRTADKENETSRYGTRTRTYDQPEEPR